MATTPRESSICSTPCPPGSSYRFPSIICCRGESLVFRKTIPSAPQNYNCCISCLLLGLHWSCFSKLEWLLWHCGVGTITQNWLKTNIFYQFEFFSRWSTSRLAHPPAGVPTIIIHKDTETLHVFESVYLIFGNAYLVFGGMNLAIGCVSLVFGSVYLVIGVCTWYFGGFIWYDMSDYNLLFQTICLWVYYRISPCKYYKKYWRNISKSKYLTFLCIRKI